MKGKMPQTAFILLTNIFLCVCLALFAKKKQIAKYSTSLNLMELSFLFFFFSGETIKSLYSLYSLYRVFF